MGFQPMDRLEKIKKIKDKREARQLYFQKITVLEGAFFGGSEGWSWFNPERFDGSEILNQGEQAPRLIDDKWLPRLQRAIRCDSDWWFWDGSASKDRMPYGNNEGKLGSKGPQREIIGTRKNPDFVVEEYQTNVKRLLNLDAIWTVVME